MLGTFALIGVLARPTTLLEAQRVWASIGPEGGPVQNVVLSPGYQDDDTVFATIHGGGVFRSTNAGDTWEQLGEERGLPATFTATLSVQISGGFATDSTAFAASVNGAYRTTDGGDSWLAVNEGLVVRDIRSLTISPDFQSDSTLFAGSYGGGIFRRTSFVTTATPVPGLTAWGLTWLGILLTVVLLSRLERDAASVRSGSG